MSAILKSFDTQAYFEFFLAVGTLPDPSRDHVRRGHAARAFRPDAFTRHAIELALFQFTEAALAGHHGFDSYKIDKIIMVSRKHRVTKSD
jgi:hypothetical protein